MTIPNVYLLDERDTPAIERYLREIRWLDPEEEVLEAKRAGHSNMNYVLRVRTGQRSFILKQSRPWVERYPQIAAPWDRTLVEAEFYQTIKQCAAVEARMPKLLGLDATAHILQLADLGQNPTFESLYEGEAFGPAELDALTTYLHNLHSRFRDLSLRNRFANTEMRKLNYEHIFRFPFRSGNGLDLDAITPGLGALACELQIDSAVQLRVQTLGQIYLCEGECLLHGDYFPGSWIRVPDSIRIIDPEFCFFGRPEFDWGVMLAHLHLCRAPAESLVCRDLDFGLVKGFAGVEIIRRLIGMAQLPLPYGLNQKQLLLKQAREMLLSKD